MCLLAVIRLREGPIYLSSGWMSHSLDKNQVVLRQILGKLSKAGLVETASGSRGGARLAREAKKITCYDIYQAVEHHALFGVHEGNPDCVVSEFVGGFMETFFEDAEQRFENELKNVRLSEVAESLNEKAVMEGFEPPPVHEPAPIRGSN